MKNIVLSLLVSILATLSGCAVEKRVTPVQHAIAVPTQVTPYNRKDWPHWIDADRDCQNTRQEMLIATSRVSVKFKDARHCTVVSGEWFGVYTGKTFTKASDVDIDHIVPLAHALGTVLTNGRGINVERLPMISRIFWSLMIQLTNLNLIRHRMNGCHHVKIIGASMASAGSASSINISCGIACWSVKRWVCWMRPANDSGNKHIPLVLEYLGSGIICTTTSGLHEIA